MRSRPQVLDVALRGDNARMLGKLALVAALMFGFGYALVPMYRSICAALGINVLSLAERAVPGNSKATASNTQVDASRTVTVEFDANARGPWAFSAGAALGRGPSGRADDGGATSSATRRSRTMSAQAIPSYAPKQASPHFNKIECFCFTQWTLAPGESRRWPVAFVIDPKLPRDVKTITLSYTFFEVGGGVPPAPEAAAAAPGEPRRGDAVVSERPRAPLREAVSRKGSFMRTARAVGWSFFGVRKSAEHEKDVASLNPVHVIAAGVIGALLLVVLLVLLVRWVVGSGVAA